MVGAHPDSATQILSRGQAANRSQDGLSPSTPLANGGEGRGEVALISLAPGA